MRYGIYLCFLSFTVMFFACQTLTTSKENVETKDDILLTQKNIILHYLNQGEPRKAHEELRRLLKQYPEDSQLLNLMGLTQMSFIHFKKAEEFFRRAIQIDRQATYELNLSSSLIEQGKSSQALHVLKKISTSKEDAYRYPERVFHNIGYAYERQNKSKSAIQYYRKALYENPNHYPSLLQLARLYQRVKMNPSAEIFYAQARQICPTCLEPTKSLALLKIAKGEKEEGKRILREYLIQKITPSDKNIISQLLSDKAFQ